MQRLYKGTLATLAVLGMASSAIAQEEGTRMEPIVFTSTTEDATTRTIPGYDPRFDQVMGSGSLMVNGDDEVTGYYFTVMGLEASQTVPYHFHGAMSGGMPTSCEGDKALFKGEGAGGVLTDLGAAAALESSESGFARVGSPEAPVMLDTPVPLADIGYINLHSTQGDPVGPGLVCANVRLNPGGFER